MKDDLIVKSDELLSYMKKRRSVRAFSKKPVSSVIIENCISIAATSPSGANDQPWTFVLVSKQEIKEEIFIRAELVEDGFYKQRITKEWRERLKPLKTNSKKGFLLKAPYLICVFAQRHRINENDVKNKNYYAMESIGIATGFLLMAIHQMGLSALTYTPAPMAFLSEILNRPNNERPYMIIAVGYPDPEYQLPGIKKKTKDEYLVIS